MRTRIYTGFSLFEFVIAVMLRLACVVGFVLTAPHYNENPMVIVIVCVFCILFLLIIGDDQIVVYEDRVTQTTNSLSSLIFKERGTTFYIVEIKLAFLELPPKVDPVELGAILIAAVLPKKSIKDKTQPIFFNLRSGKTVKFDSNLESKKLKRIVQLVNSLIKANSH